MSGDVLIRGTQISLRPPTAQKPFCDKLEQMIDLIYGLLQRAKAFITSQISTIERLLANFLHTDLYQSGEEVISAFEKNILSQIPSFDDLTLVIPCNLFTIAKSDSLNKLMKMIKEVLGDIFDAVFAALELWANIAAFPSALAIYYLESFLKGMKFDSLISKYDSILTCIDQICKRDISGKVEKIDKLLFNMKIGMSGFLDRDAIYSAAKLTSDQRSHINTVIEQMYKTKTIQDTSAALAKKSVKSLQKALANF